MAQNGTKNLIPQNMRTKEEQREIARKGGQASGKARRNKAMLKDCLQALMEKKYLDEKTGKKITGAELLSIDLFEKAIKETDTAKKARAFEVLRDTSGQKPVDKVEQTNTNITIDFGDIEEDAY
jgi:hypothetical protein